MEEAVIDLATSTANIVATLDGSQFSALMTVLSSLFALGVFCAALLALFLGVFLGFLFFRCWR